MNAVGEFRGPFQDLHPSHRTADDTEDVTDLQLIQQHRMRAYHIADGDNREGEGIWFAGGVVDLLRPQTAHTAADDIGAEDVIAFSIDNLTVADDIIPPAGLAGDGVGAGDILIAGEGVADDDDVIFGGIQRAVCIIGNVKILDLDPGIEFQCLFDCYFIVLCHCCAKNTQMSEDSKLSELRNKIDAIDRELLKLLGSRSDIVLQVGKHKGDNNGNNFIRSGRETKMLRDILKQGAGKFPKFAIRSMWRSIISASLSLESGLKVSLPANASFELHKTVIEYFGSFTNYREYGSDEEILKSIDKHTIGIFTLDTGWWLNLSDHPNLKIFARLSDKVFAVARLDTEESGDDKTLAITHADKHKGHQLATHGKVKLIEVAGFHNEINDAVVIGHYGL